MAAWSSTAEQNTPPAACRGGATQSPKMAVIFLGESRIVGQLGQAHLAFLEGALLVPLLAEPGLGVDAPLAEGGVDVAAE